MRRSFRLLALPLFVVACQHAGPPVPSAADVVAGRVPDVHPDTIEDQATISIDRGRWTVRPTRGDSRDFWSDVAVLDVGAAERSAGTVDQRTFAAALRSLMDSDPEGAAVVFGALHETSTDRTVRSRARVGLTMALSWRSDWPALARLAAQTDSTELVDPDVAQAGVERWAHALAIIPSPLLDVPEDWVTLPLRRSAFGTPVISVRVNGKPHEFWLDTGASMTLLSGAVAKDAGVLLASSDTLALGVVAGHIPALAVLIDSLGIGPVVARNIGAALVSPTTLRLDRRTVNGVPESVQIDGVIGTDVLRHLDIVLDAGAGTISLRKPRADRRAVRNLYWVGYPVVRLVTKEGRPTLFGLDTGAEATYVTTSLLQKLPRTPVAMRRGTISGLGTESHRTEWVARQIALSDGDHAVSLKNVAVGPERRWTFVVFDGVIGSDVALASRMHLDFLNGVFDIQRSDGNGERGINVMVTH